MHLFPNLFGNIWRARSSRCVGLTRFEVIVGFGPLSHHFRDLLASALQETCNQFGINLLRPPRVKREFKV